uniref:40S ribosomal protein S15 n=1 Tax=Parascaris equorum TaxID=6256 RepID=A0A914RSH1_PAREQ
MVKQLYSNDNDQLAKLLPCRARRRLARGLKRKHLTLLARLRRAKKEASVLEKPATVKTHLRDMLVLPEMVGSMIGVYNGKVFNQVGKRSRGSRRPLIGTLKQYLHNALCADHSYLIGSIFRCAKSIRRSMKPTLLRGVQHMPKNFGHTMRCVFEGD